MEVHTVEGGLNTGAAVILAAGGGHNTLNVGSESADLVPYSNKVWETSEHAWRRRASWSVGLATGHQTA